MKIELHEIKISELFDGYEDRQENGVVAYGGKLNVRPAFQREFIYKDKQRDEVIRTIKNDFPLNVMYWIKSDTGYELMDGQQRTLSICKYLHDDFQVDNQLFSSLYDDQQQQILNYELSIYICEGTDKERIDWFQVINTAGEKLNDQEVLNAIYSGSWVSDAKKYFSKNNCPAFSFAKDYMAGNPIRQDYLETAISWIAERDKISIASYMAKHKHDVDAHEIWLYFQTVINWVKAIFPTYRKEMKGVAWGIFHNHYGNKKFNPSELDARVSELMADDDVTRKSGIYEYLLDGQEKHLSLRAFTETQKRTQYEKQKGLCARCGKHFDFSDMEGDHIIAWSKGGHTLADNLQILCKSCNRKKSKK